MAQTKNTKNKVEDIFDEVDKRRAATPPPPALRGPRPEGAQPTAPLANKRAYNRHFPFILLIVFIVLVVLGLAGIVAITVFDLGIGGDTDTSHTVTSTVVNTKQPINQSAVRPQGVPSVEPAALDEDGDGLSDEEEAQLGTDPGSIDTDGDGLFDKEETSVYHTDPLNPDSDHDGNTDGTEVANGYDPLGDGLLRDLQAEITNFTQ